MLSQLTDAVKSRDESLVREYLKRKPQLGSPEGGTLLWYAVLDDEVEIASMLVHAGADLNTRNSANFRNKTFLHHLVRSIDPRHHRLAVLMMNHGADVNARDSQGRSVLWQVIDAHHSAIDLVRELLNRGATVDYRDICFGAMHPLAPQLLPILLECSDSLTRDSRAVLALRQLSINFGNESEILPTLKVLLDMNLPVKRINKDVAILFMAVVTNKIKMVQMLIEYGVDVNQKAKKGDSALHVACQGASNEIIKLLLRHGAKLDAIDNLGRTPFSMMQYRGYMSGAYQLVVKTLAFSASRRRIVRDCDLRIIENHAEVKTYYELCMSELKTMQTTTVLNDISFYFVLVKSVRELAFLTRNDNFVTSYNEFPRKDEFPIFHEDMEELFSEAEKWKNLITDREEALREGIKHTIPYLPLERVIFYLYLNDM